MYALDNTFLTKHVINNNIFIDKLEMFYVQIKKTLIIFIHFIDSDFPNKCFTA